MMGVALHLTGSVLVKGKGKLLTMVALYFLPYGCRSGRAMVKYPGYRKNAQHYITQPMPAGVLLQNGPCTVYLRSGNFAQQFFFASTCPGLTTASPQCTMACMQYYYVLCRQGPLVLRHYVRLDHLSADILHDSLVPRYDFVQVCAVARGQVEQDLLL
jgi:hypothetical protein